MNLYSSSLLSFGLAADACAIALTIGLTIKNIKLSKAIKVGLFMGGFQGLMPLLGWLGGFQINGLLAVLNSWLIFAVLVFLGGKMIYESLAEEEAENLKPKANFLDAYTLIALSIATSIDALAAGLGLSLVDTDILSLAGVISITTFFLSCGAVYVGHFFGDLSKQKIELLGGGVLIVLGIKFLLEGTI